MFQMWPELLFQLFVPNSGAACDTAPMAFANRRLAESICSGAEHQGPLDDMALWGTLV